MNQLERFMADIESETNLGHSRLDDIKDSFGDINDLDQRQKHQLDILKSQMDSYKVELAQLTSDLDDAEDKDPHVLWGRIKQAVADAAKYEILAKKAVGVFHNADDPQTNFLLASKNIRESVMQGMNQREEEFQQKSQELDVLIDDVEPKIRELSIGEINQAVCGAYTEDCDEVCGGAQCLTSNGKQHCGNANYDVFNRGPRVNTCEESAYQISVSAKTHAENAQKRLKDIRSKVDKSLSDTQEVREDAIGAKIAAEDVRQKATDVEKNIRDYTDRIINLVEEIEDFLSADEHTDPEDILKVAKQVLAIELPDANKINELKEKMNSLSIRPSDSSSPDDNLSLTAVTSIAQKASKVLREAQELSDKVNKAAENFEMKEENCNEASEMNREANTVNDEAKIKIAETTTLIEDLKVKLSELAGLVDDQTIKQKRTELNNKITESNSNIVMATEKLEEADEMFEVFKPRYDEFKESGDRELAIDFTNNVDELRHTQDSAKDLEANVDKLLEDVKSWHSKLKDLMDSYDKVKNEVETSTQNLSNLKLRAESVRKNIYQKLYNPEQCET